jgi:hypothetical protein
LTLPLLADFLDLPDESHSEPQEGLALNARLVKKEAELRKKNRGTFYRTASIKQSRKGQGSRIQSVRFQSNAPRPYGLQTHTLLPISIVRSPDASCRVASKGVVVQAAQNKGQAPLAMGPALLFCLTPTCEQSREGRKTKPNAYCPSG